MRYALLVGGATATTALAVIVADACGQGRFHGTALEVAMAVGLGATQGAAWPRLLTPRGAWRRAWVSGLLGGSAAFVLARFDAGWLDLGPFGAGPPGELALVLFPVVTVLALAGALAITPRGAWARRLRDR